MRVSLRDYWRLLAVYLRPQGRRAALLGGLLLVGIALQLIAPQLLRRFIDDARAGEELRVLLGVAGGFLGIALLTQAVTLVETWVAENVGWTATNNLRADLALHVLRLDPQFHGATTPGALIERVDGDVAKLGNFFARFVVQVLGNGLLAIGILVLLFRIDWRIGAALSAFAVIAFLIMNALRDVSVPHWAAARQASADLFGYVEERLAGTEDIRSAGAVPYVMRGNHLRSRELLQRQQRANLIGSISYSTSILLFAGGTAVALGVGATLYRDGAITLGTVFLIFQYAELLNRPIEALSRQLEDLQQASASIVRVQDLLDTQSAIADGAGAPLPDGALDVHLDGVTFGYRPDEPVLRDVDIRLAPGEVLGLVGRTGSGKTSITRLLFRLYDPGQGAIRLGGTDIRDCRLADLRARVGMVTQEIQLFHASVRNNLTLFDPTIPDWCIHDTLDELGLGRWYESLPDGLDSVLASGGGLSAGEAQLLAFARVFLRDPGLVILDEASSRLDPATEWRLERAVDRLLAGRTGIVIAHRLATVRRADSIAVLEAGRVVEYGPRQELADDPTSRFAAMLRTGHEFVDSVEGVEVRV